MRIEEIGIERALDGLRRCAIKYADFSFDRSGRAKMADAELVEIFRGFFRKSPVAPELDARLHQLVSAEEIRDEEDQILNLMADAWDERMLERAAKVLH